MFSFLKKTNAVLYSETEKLKRIFQSGEQIPYFNQMRVIFEGIINLIVIESKIHISSKEKTLGQKIHNPDISHYLYKVIKLKENEVEEFVDVVNKGSHLTVENTNLLEKWDQKRLVEFLYNSLKSTLEKIEKLSDIPAFDIDLYNQFVEPNKTAIEKIKQNKKQLKESESKLEQINKDIFDKEKQLRELNEFYEKRQTEIVLTESTVENNDKHALGVNFIKEGDYESGLRVFTSMHISNIMDLRAYIGILLCKFKVNTIVKLTKHLIENKINLAEVDVYKDSQKFLNPKDKQFIKSIAENIEIEIAFNELNEYMKKNNFDGMRSKIDFLASKSSLYDLNPFIEFLNNEPIYIDANTAWRRDEIDRAIKLIKSIPSYKDAQELLKEWKEEKAQIKKEEAERLARAKELEKQKREKEERERISRIYNTALDNLKHHRFDKAIVGFKETNSLIEISNVEKCRELNEYFLQFKNGEITKYEYLLARKNYSEYVINIIESRYYSVDKIDAKHKINILLSKENLNDFIKAYKLMEQYYSYSDFKFSEQIIEIASKNFDLEFLESVYIINEVPKAKKHLEEYLKTNNISISDDAMNYGIEELDDTTNLYKILAKKKRNQIEQKLQHAYQQEEYNLVINICEDEKISKYISRGIHKKYYYTTLFILRKSESISKIDFFSVTENRELLINYLDIINKSENAKEKELDFLRFLVKTFKNTKHSQLLEKIILFACIARSNQRSLGDYDKEFENISDTSILYIGRFIQNIDKSCLDVSRNNLDNALILNKENIDPDNIARCINKIKKQTKNKKTKNETSHNFFYPNDVFENIALVLYCIFAFYIVIPIFLVRKFQNRKNAKQKTQAELHYRVCLFKVSLIYGVNDKLQFSDKEEEELIALIARKIYKN